MKYIAFIALLATVPPIHARAEVPAETLYKVCLHKSGSAEDGLCMSYIQGFVDGLALGGVIAADFQSLICLPKDGISQTQARLIFQKFVRDHPEKLNTAAALLVGEAIGVAFPCQKKAK